MKLIQFGCIKIENYKPQLNIKLRTESFIYKPWALNKPLHFL
jgi:hypothetical protein